MPIYIATVWTLHAVDADQIGDAGIDRRVRCAYAENPIEFRQAIERDLQAHLWVELGPIGLSKSQRTRF